jgi:hypothetical protein
MITALFIIFVIVLAIILVVVSLVTNPMLGIFVVSLIACLMLNNKNKENNRKL